jgi:hypothetical protein
VDLLGTGPTPVVESVPGVPTAAITAHLDKPRPDLIRGRLDRDGHRRPPLAPGDQVGARIGPSDFIIGCAPAPEPRAQPNSKNDGSRAGRTRDLASECHITSVGPCTGRRKGQTSHVPSRIERDCWHLLGAAPTTMVMGVATITNRAPPANTGLSNGNRLLIATPRSIEPWISPTEPAIAPAEMTDSEVTNQPLRCRCTPVEPSRSPLGK